MPPTSDAVKRARAAIQIGAPSISAPATAVTALQEPLIRTPFIGTTANSQNISASGISWPWIKWLQQLFATVKSQTTSLEDTHANRIANYPAGSFPAGSSFYETDTGITYIDNGTAWVYAAGVRQATQATLPIGLGASDSGLLVSVTDYRHLLQWTGSAWEWGPGEPGSGQIASFLSNPGAGWHLCNGSLVNQLLSNGTILAVTLPNYATAAYLKLGTAASIGPNAPSGNTTAVSAGTPAGSVSTPTFTGASDTTSVDSADVLVQAGTADTNVAAAGHTHTVTPTGTVSTPTFTGSALGTHSHGPGSIELENTVLLAYFRQ